MFLRTTRSRLSATAKRLIVLGPLTVIAVYSPLTAASAHAAAQQAGSAKHAEHIEYLSVSPGIKPAPDGKLHDAYSETTFHVRAGTPVKLVIHNTDDVPHGIVSAAAGVHLLVKPGTHTYTLFVKKAGVYRWHCNRPCDPYSMSHVGYMMGKIVAS